VSAQDRQLIADKTQKPRKSLFQELLETLLLTLVLFGVARFSRPGATSSSSSSR
jgi:hypothetical protein